MHPLLNIALKIVSTTSGVLSREFDRIAAYPDESAANIAQLRLDLETKIASTIHEFYPQHAVLFPGYVQASTAETVWLIDILSGVDNYTRAIPHFAICLAIQERGKVEHSIIHDPLLNETFSASRNQHAQLNKFRIHASKAQKLSNKLLFAGNQVSKLEADETKFYSRQTGCNALMLAYVANGRFDGFAGNDLSEFELAAGSLLIKMAGGLYSDLSGDNTYAQKKELFATNSKLFKLLLQEINRNEPRFPF